MVLLFLSEDGLDGFDSSFVFSPQSFELMLKVAKDDTLHCHCGCGDCLATEQPRD